MPSPRQTGIAVACATGTTRSSATSSSPRGRVARRRVPDRELARDGARREAGLFAPVAADTLAQVPEAYRPSSGAWTGIAARSTVFAYNPTLLPEDQLPASLLDLAEPEWQGRWAASPSGADFQAIVSALLALKGEEATTRVARGHEGQRPRVPGQPSVMAGRQRRRDPRRRHLPLLLVRRPGQHGREQRQRRRSTTSRARTPGAFVSVSGGGVLASSQHQDAAQAFLALHHRRRRPDDPPDGRLVRVPDRQRGRRQPGARAARRAGGAGHRPLAARQHQDHRADDRGGDPVARPSACRRSVTTRHGRGALLEGCGLRAHALLPRCWRPPSLVTAIGLIPIVFVVLASHRDRSLDGRGLVIRPRVAELLLNTAALVGIDRAALLRARCRGSRGWSCAPTCPDGALFAVLFATPLAIPAFVDSYGWAASCPRCRSRWRGPGRGPRLLPAGLPAGARRRCGALDPALEESLAALGRSPGPCLRGRGAAAAPAADPGRRAARRPAPAGGVRRVRDAPLRHVHDGHRRASTGRRSAGPAAAMLAGVLVLCCLGLLLFEGLAAAAPGMRASVRAHRGRRRRVAIGRATCPAPPVAIGVVGLAVGVPIASIVRWLGAGGIAVWSSGSSRPWPRPSAPAWGRCRHHALAAAGRLLVGPVPEPSLARPRGVRLPTSALPGIVIALALVTVAIRSSGRPTRRPRWCCSPTSCCSCRGAGQPPRRHRAGAGIAGGGGPFPGRAARSGVPAGHRATLDRRRRSLVGPWCSWAWSTS